MSVHELKDIHKKSIILCIYLFYGISGMQTGNLGVIQKDDICYTNIERTLLDIVVRPQYSGGVNNVLKVYNKAKSLVNLENFIKYYKKIKYIYPYYQSIGFYLEKTNYASEFVDVFFKMKKQYDFYLDYGMKNPKYYERWRLFYPNTLDDNN